jgi:hypothetical protein
VRIEINEHIQLDDKDEIEFGDLDTDFCTLVVKGERVTVNISQLVSALETMRTRTY